MPNRIMLIAAGLLLALLVAGMAAYGYAATLGKLIPPHVYQRKTITVRNWPCQEDEVLRGKGDFNGRRWDFYRCWNPGW